MASFRELLQQAKASISEVDTAGGEALLEEGYVLLDVREPDEYEQGAVPGSIHIPRGQLESNIENQVSDRNAKLVVMCAGGVRSAFAVQTLEQLGYTNAVSMDGGFNKWKDEGRDWKRPQALSAGDPRPPAPSNRTLASSSLGWPSSPISGTSR